ncbi:hypothetical protein LZM18_28270 [Pseudomonas aeruginosa]|nr:hypothetical protein [Pseudomonas aeruginosa]
MAIATDAGAPLVPAVSATPIRKRPGRTESQCAIAALNDRGQLEVRLTGQQGSGVLRSMSEANCFVVLAHEQGQVNAGDAVQVLLFDGIV